jgi:hypothetical protein
VWHIIWTLYNENRNIWTKPVDLTSSILLLKTHLVFVCISWFLSSFPHKEFKRFGVEKLGFKVAYYFMASCSTFFEVWIILKLDWGWSTRCLPESLILATVSDIHRSFSLVSSVRAAIDFCKLILFRWMQLSVFSPPPIVWLPTDLRHNKSPCVFIIVPIMN